VELVERVGAYVGLAAFLGLAVLALLYFSQARDVRRLRDWAGRAPERAVEQAERASDVEQATEVAPATPAATAAAQAQHSLPPTPLSQASQPRPRKPLRERIQNVHIPHLHYIGMAVLGVLVLAGGAYGAIQLTGDDGGSEPAVKRSERGDNDRSSGGGDGGRRTGANVDPAQVTVAVLNGTTVQGLAAQVGEEVRGAGFKLGTIGNAARIDQTTSVVLYRDGQARAARAVANRLGIDKTEQVDSVNEEIAGSFDVIVLVGSDRGG
jgi:LytR cell envelope-related transcriptional attenuator